MRDGSGTEWDAWADASSTAMRRLKTRAQFQAVLAGEVVARTPHFVLHRLALATPDDGAASPAALPFPTAQAPEAWVGAMLPKRWAKRSVTRHAIKRQIYHRDEWAEPRFMGHAHVVRLRATFSTKRFISAWSEPLRLAVRHELAQLLQRAQTAPASSDTDPPPAAQVPAP
jgi:ribonuclease P protein component